MILYLFLQKLLTSGLILEIISLLVFLGVVLVNPTTLTLVTENVSMIVELLLSAMKNLQILSGPQEILVIGVIAVVLMAIALPNPLVIICQEIPVIIIAALPAKLEVGIDPLVVLKVVLRLEFLVIIVTIIEVVPLADVNIILMTLINNVTHLSVPPAVGTIPAVFLLIKRFVIMLWGSVVSLGVR